MYNIPSQDHFETRWETLCKVPVPVVWSLSGPVPTVGEEILVLVQSKSSVASWWKVQKPVSKVQFKAEEENKVLTPFLSDMRIIVCLSHLHIFLHNLY